MRSRQTYNLNLNNIHNIYFIGIGGIGMSALTLYFHNLGKNVAGYDKTPSEITDNLLLNKIDIHFEDAIENIPYEFKNPEENLIVYTPAIPKNHQELNYFISKKFDIYKRAELLGHITRNTFCFAVAGTHGKTTTSAILAHLLVEAVISVTAFLGGISENFNSNFITRGNQYTVVEADEFDRSFLHLHPNIACITNTDADHLDIYNEKEALQNAFVDFSQQLKSDGKLFVHQNVAIKGMTYGIETDADYSIQNIKIEEGSYIFDIKTPQEIIDKVTFNIPGRHNLANALVAFIMANQVELSTDKLVKALATFKGVKRRFSYQIKAEDLIFIDDYAHHPTEINAVHDAIRELYPDKKILAVFQPHLYSRTRDFADDFAESLSKFDEILLLPIYPAREEPIAGITSKWLLRKVNNQHKKLVSKIDLITAIQNRNSEILLTIGAGDIGEEAIKIKQALTMRDLTGLEDL